MMNKILRIMSLPYIFLAVMFVFCGCNQIDEDDAAKQLGSQIFECINNEDTEGLKNLFSENASSSYDLDKEIEELFTFFDGKIISYDDFGSGITHEKASYGKTTLLTISPLVENVKTDTGKIYMISFFACLVCEDDEKEKGIYGLNIILDDEIIYSVGEK